MSENDEAPDSNGSPPASSTSERQSQPIDAEAPPRLPFPVVGIGASAGGIEAIGDFLKTLRPDAGMAYVMIQHLPPDRDSMMVDILSRKTSMPVSEVSDGVAVQPNHVYVIRPGHTLIIENGRLHLGERLSSPGNNRPVDDFFRSLAEEQRERAIGVILSGMGSNGTAGAQVIKAVGGLCIAQEPESAQYPSMPRHLIDAGYADYILRPGDIADVLLAYADHPYSRGGRETDAARLLAREHQNVREILAVLRTRTRQDFNGYKKPTLLRRIQRRMGLSRLTDVGEYAKFLRQSPTEVTALADDLLIHVTGFFRDALAWETLRERVIVPLIASREPESSIRCWVTACSSGEEAYSLGILLAEEAERIGKRLDIKVFATDMAERSLQNARAGVYPGGIETEISPARLERFFQREDAVYRVRQDLRDIVVFAPQNVLQDPPFSRLDIATCRNLLIYLEPAVQQRVIRLLHFGLREGGTLFLGTSETALTGTDDMFEQLDKKARIFRRIGPTRHGAVDFPLPHSIPRPNSTGDRSPAEMRSIGPRASLPQIITRSLLEEHTPAAVAVDRDHRIVFYHGNTEPFLAAPRGEPTRDLLSLARESVRGAIRTALHRAMSENAPVTVQDGWIETQPGQRVRVAVRASPLDTSSAPDHFVISFQERGELRAQSGGPPSETGDEADEALRRVRDELQSTVEELQTSNEELKASNEEVTSTNEELQSTNEELETSREEMQSLNEELSTVNSQLQSKIEEHQAARNDLSSLLTSTDIAVLFLDTEFRVRRFTPPVRDLLELIPSDIGRPLSDFARKFSDPELLGDASAAIERLITSEQEIPADGNRWYLRRITPYRTSDNRIDGVVVTFVNITRRKESEDSVRRTAERDAFLVVLADALRPLTDPLEIKAEASRLLGERLRVSRVAFGDFLPDGRVIHEREYVRHGVSNSVSYDFDCYDHSLLQQFREGKTFIVSNIAGDAAPQQQKAMFETLRIRAHVSVPILEKGHLTGILCVAQSTERQWTPGEVSLIEDVAHRAGEAIARVRAEFDLRESEARLAAELNALKRLHELTERLLASPNLSSALSEVLTAALELHETQMGTIQVLDPGSQSPRLVVQRGFDPALVSARGDEWAFGSISAVSSRSGRRAVVEDFQTHPDFVADRPSAAEFGYRSAQSTPLMTRRGELQGVLATYARQPHRPPDRVLQITDLYARLAAHLIERIRTEAALLESEQRFRMAIEAARMGFWDWDAGSGKIKWEPTHNRLLGLPPEQAEGTFERFMACVHPDDRVGLSEVIGNAAERGADCAGDFRVVHADGTVRWIAGFGRPITTAGGKTSRMIGGLLDITDRKQIELERAQLLRREQAARTEAESANHMKDEFLAALSHELRTPLSAILLWTKLLGDKATPDTAQLREGLSAIKISAEAQKNLIEDLLDTSRIATGKMRLQIRDIELVPLMKDVLDAILPAAKAKTIGVTIAFDENVGVVQLDAERFRQIAWNLLQNAVKFTPPHGSIQVRLWRNEDEVQLTIKDNGRGIAPEFLPHLFERFRQYELASTRSGGGLGLGLSIVKQLVELHGGTIDAESAGLNRGATFTVQLPLPKLAGDGRNHKPAGGNGAVDLTDSKILIVEDDTSTRHALQEILHNAGATVTAADSADAAIAAARLSRPDLIISDIGLPGTDGYSLLRNLRAWEESEGMAPVAAVALTAFANDDQRERALEAGFQQHLGKPIDTDQLLSIVKSLLSGG
jgi:PAS domain S-box-containing protein